ncbi:MAG TPA: site-2 protease family protein [Actinomycetota bacterium]
MHLYTGIGVALGFAVGLLGHEYVQHRVAFALGDRTPKLMGRMQLGPNAHFDPLGMAVLPALFVFVALFASAPYNPMFGYGKPHALTRSLLRNPKRHWVLVSIAGPAAPMLVGIVTGNIARSMGPSDGAAELLAWMTITLMTLAVLELLPLPGMDGGRILGMFLKPSASMRMDELAPYKAMFLLVIFIFDPLRDAVVGLIRVVCDAVAAGVCG